MKEDDWYETLYDKDGNPVKRLIEYAPVNSKPGEFTTHDSSHGHCGLCGSISCKGTCFK